MGSAAFSVTTLFFVFLKAGAVLFGSGYVLLAFLRSDLVERLGWLTEAQLLQAVAVGQVTLGPVFTTATFIGFILGGPLGAALASVGIFLPAFDFVALSAPFLPRLRASPVAAAFLDAVNAASTGAHGDGDLATRLAHPYHPAESRAGGGRAGPPARTGQLGVAGARRRGHRAPVGPLTTLLGKAGEAA